MTPSIHAPVAAGECESCHLGHGGDRPKLLKLNVAAVPPVPYATSAYALCFDCHDPLLGTEKESLGVTGFRDGRQNLHRVHLQGSDPATCGTCHDYHASSQVKLLRAKAGSGKGEVTLTFAEAPNGGSCTTSCHDPMTYVRELSKKKR